MYGNIAVDERDIGERPTAAKHEELITSISFSASVIIASKPSNYLLRYKDIPILAKRTQLEYDHFQLYTRAAPPPTCPITPPSCLAPRGGVACSQAPAGATASLLERQECRQAPPALSAAPAEGQPQSGGAAREPQKQEALSGEAKLQEKWSRFSARKLGQISCSITPLGGQGPRPALKQRSGSARRRVLTRKARKSAAGPRRASVASTSACSLGPVNQLGSTLRLRAAIIRSSDVTSVASRTRAVAAMNRSAGSK